VLETAPSWNYTTFLNLLFILVIAVLGARFLTTGGPAMLRAMSQPGGHEHHDHSVHEPDEHEHAEHHHH
jgi:hypothetical protein